MHQIQSKQLVVSIDNKGAELKNIYHKGNGLEYMWSGDPAYWAKTSPVLFPIVGTLKNNQFKYKEQFYALSRHGFARDQVFSVIDDTENSVSFAIKSNEESLKVYPFHFRFSIIYTVEENRLRVEYLVENTGDERMLFSVGGHPAFKLPLVNDTAYDDYKLVFEKKEMEGRWPISSEGLIEEHPQPLLLNMNELPLNKQLFKKDAIVLKALKSSFVKLVSEKTEHGLTFHFDGFPYLGLWAAPNADFICVEPWCGIADSVDADQQLENKEGIIALPAGEQFSVSWAADFF